MTAWDGLNRRQFPRINFPCMVVVKCDQGEESVLLTHTDNLGIGGVCVTLKQSFKMFTPVSLELDLMDAGSHIHCNGKVVWSIRRKIDDKQKPLFYDVGIEFIDISERDQKRVYDVVDRFVRKGFLIKRN